MRVNVMYIFTGGISIYEYAANIAGIVDKICNPAGWESKKNNVLQRARRKIRERLGKSKWR